MGLVDRCWLPIVDVTVQIREESSAHPACMRKHRAIHKVLLNSPILPKILGTTNRYENNDDEDDRDTKHFERNVH